MLSAILFSMNNERRDMPMLHDLQHQFAYNRRTRAGFESPICTREGV